MKCTTSSRRNFLKTAGICAASLPVYPALAVDDKEPERKLPVRNPIGVSTYSYWGFRREEFRPIEKCIDLAAEQGFDGVEILQVQMQDSILPISRSSSGTPSLTAFP